MFVVFQQQSVKAGRGPVATPASLTPRAPASNQRDPSNSTAIPNRKPGPPGPEGRAMKIRNSLKSAKLRDKNCRVVRRHGRVYVINKKNPRMKARQG